MTKKVRSSKRRPRTRTRDEAAQAVICRVGNALEIMPSDISGWRKGTSLISRARGLCCVILRDTLGMTFYETANAMKGLPIDTKPSVSHTVCHGLYHKWADAIKEHPDSASARIVREVSEQVSPMILSSVGQSA